MRQSTNSRPPANSPGRTRSLWISHRDTLVKDAYGALNQGQVSFDLAAVTAHMRQAVTRCDLAVVSTYDLVTGGGKASAVVTDEQIVDIIDNAAAKVMAGWDPTYRVARAIAAGTKYDLLRFEKIAHLTIPQQVQATGLSARAVSYMRAKVKNLADPQVRALHEKAVAIRQRWTKRRAACLLRNKRRAAALRAAARAERLRLTAYTTRGHGLFTGLEAIAARNARLAEMADLLPPLPPPPLLGVRAS